MNILILFFFFIFGTIIGSFLNVVLFRYNTGRTIGGRSKCFSCRRTLSPIDLVPVVSYIVFGGRCRTCKSHVSFQYPAVELLTGILFAGVYILYSPLFFLNTPLFLFNVVFALLVMSLLVLITVYDLRHKIIPDLFSYTFAIVAFVVMFLRVEMILPKMSVFGLSSFNFYIALPTMSHLFAGIILAFPFYFLWLVSRGRWMGLGDAKLALGIGWFLGLAKGGTAIIYGFWIGAGVSVVLLLIQKILDSKKRGKHSLHTSNETHTETYTETHTETHSTELSMKSEIPFAPFLVLGILIVYFFGYNMFSVLELI